MLGAFGAVFRPGVVFVAVFEGFFEFADPLAQAPPDLRQAAGPEKKKADKKNDE
jgi:hypothetical protein